MSARTRRRQVAVAVGLLGALAGPAGASAAGDPGGDVAVSSDGVSWGPELAAPLFDASIHWVPGDIRTESFFVRNDGATAASLRVEGRDTVADELTDERAVALFARADGGRWQRLPVGEMSGPLTVVAIPVGTVSRVDVRAVFEPSADNHSQQERADLTFVVGLEDARGVEHLAAAGAPPITVPVVAGATLVGAGAVLVGRRRVRRG